MHPEKQSPGFRVPDETDEDAQLKKNLVMEVVSKGCVGRSKISGCDVGLVITTRRPRTIVCLETPSGKNRINEQYIAFLKVLF